MNLCAEAGWAVNTKITAGLAILEPGMGTLIIVHTGSHFATKQISRWYYFLQT